MRFDIDLGFIQFSSLYYRHMVRMKPGSALYIKETTRKETQ